VVETWDGRILTKRFYRRGGNVTLTSVNPVDRQEPIHLKSKQVKEVRVVVGALFE